MRADVGPLSGLSADMSTQSRLQRNRPGDSRFGVSVYPLPGQSVHTLTPACQRRDLQDITRGAGRGEAQREERERERVRQSWWGRDFSFLNNKHTASDSNKQYNNYYHYWLKPISAAPMRRGWSIWIETRSQIWLQLLKSKEWLDCLTVVNMWTASLEKKEEEEEDAGPDLLKPLMWC